MGRIHDCELTTRVTNRTLFIRDPHLFIDLLVDLLIHISVYHTHLCDMMLCVSECVRGVMDEATAFKALDDAEKHVVRMLQLSATVMETLSAVDFSTVADTKPLCDEFARTLQVTPSHLVSSRLLSF